MPKQKPAEPLPIPPTGVTVPVYRAPPPEQPVDPDTIDRIFEMLIEVSPELAARAEQLAEMKAAVRDEFGGQHLYLAKRVYVTQQPEIVNKVLALFNGRNATEVARRLEIGRASVYRILKQAGRR